MNENPYAAPGSVITATPRTGESIRLYSPTQVACGTLISEPIGLIYFLSVNFSALKNDRLQKKTYIYGALLIIGLLILLPFLPNKFPGSPFTIAYMYIARHIAQTYQMAKQAITDSAQYDFQSNWRVFGFGLLCLVGSIIVILGPLMLLAALGVWRA
jgi:hypothetical protein